MARVEGAPGRYAAQQVSKRNILICSLLCGAEFAIGLSLGAAWFLRKSLLGSLALAAGAVVVTALATRFFRSLERAARDWEKGRDGEVLVGRALATKLPNTFRVINDLQTEWGNIDHVVIGPTGVFAVETKNWRGLVTDDGHGELVLNGKPTDKPFIRQFTRTIMAIRERWMALAKTDRFIQGVMVFSSAYEDTHWGKTGNIHCTSIDRIPSYFLEQKPERPLSRDEVRVLARAFLALARMDSGFDKSEGQPREQENGQPDRSRVSDGQGRGQR